MTPLKISRTASARSPSVFAQGSAIERNAAPFLRNNFIRFRSSAKGTSKSGPPGSTEAKKEKVSETEVNHTESIKTVDDELTPSQTKELESIVNEMVEKTVEEQESNVGQKLSLEEPGEFDKLDTSKMMELTGHDDNDEPPSLSENK